MECHNNLYQMKDSTGLLYLLYMSKTQYFKEILSSILLVQPVAVGYGNAAAAESQMHCS